jgi:hypothetical protein
MLPGLRGKDIASLSGGSNDARWQNRFGLIDFRGNAPAILAAAYESNAAVLFQFLMYPSRHGFITRR